MKCEIISIEELKEELEMQYLCNGVTSWNVIEAFPKGLKSVVVQDLRLLIDDDVIMCQDKDDLLLQKKFVACFFPLWRVLCIQKYATYEKILFANGDIKIAI